MLGTSEGAVDKLAWGRKKIPGAGGFEGEDVWMIENAIGAVQR